MKWEYRVGRLRWKIEFEGGVRRWSLEEGRWKNAGARMELEEWSWKTESEDAISQFDWSAAGSRLAVK